MTLYFAYGSNLDELQMRERCPGALVVGPAVLKRHRLAFVGHSFAWGGAVATIVPDPSAEVDGLLYALGERDVAALDRAEGAPWVYRRVQIAVRCARRSIVVTTYVHCGVEPGAPSADYLRRIRRAYRGLGFDQTPLDLHGRAA